MLNFSEDFAQKCSSIQVATLDVIHVLQCQLPRKNIHTEDSQGSYHVLKFRSPCEQGFHLFLVDEYR